MLKWLFGRKSEATQKETNAAPEPSTQQAAPAVEPTTAAAPAPAPSPAPAAAMVPEPAPALESRPEPAAPAVEQIPAATPDPTPSPAPTAAMVPESAPALESRPEPAAPAPAAPTAVAEPQPAPAPSMAASSAPAIQTPKAALLKQSLSLLADGSDVEPKVGLDAVAVAPPLVEAAKVVKVQAGGRRVVASFGDSAKVRVYSKRADGTYRLEGAPAQSASRLIVGATA